jgi:hypothetical protein
MLVLMLIRTLVLVEAVVLGTVLQSLVPMVVQVLSL